MKSTNYEVSHYAVFSFLCNFSLGYSTLCWLTVLSICFYHVARLTQNKNSNP